VDMTALVMAGGKATRMNCAIEKPLLEVGSKSMLEHVVGALKHSEIANRIIVAVSGNTPRTACKAKELGVEILETPGKDYISDMKFAIRKLGLSVVFVVSADLPFISREILDRAAEKFRSCGKPTLAVMCPASIYARLGSKPLHVFQADGRSLAPIGINIVDGRRIDEPELEQEVLVTESEDLALNVNTPSDLESARKRAKALRIDADE
jgi:adenosylcobinamide-phosphate guanylyltransferase